MKLLSNRRLFSGSPRFFGGSLRLFGVILLTLSLVFIFLSGLALADSTPSVVTFEVQGNDHVPVEKVLGAISNSKIGEPLNTSNVQLDLQAIMALGYFADARVKTEALLNGIKLIFVVVENPAFKELQISGLTKVDPEKLRPFFTQKPGEIFNSTVFQNDLGKAIKFCKEQLGYLVQNKEISQIAPDGIMRLELFELRYGKIVIQGLTRTKDYVIKRELLFKEGDIIDTNILQKSIMKVMQLRLFDNPDVRFEITTDPEKVDLILNVKEAVGLGEISPQLSWAPATNQVTGSIIYSTPNLMGLGENLSLNLNYGETISTNNLTNNQFTSNAQFSFSEPWLDSQHTSFQLTMGDTLWEREATIMSWDPSSSYSNPATPAWIQMDQTNLSLSFGRPIGNGVTANLGLNLERDALSDDPYASPVTPLPTPTTNHSYTFWDNSAQVGLSKNELNYQDAFYVNGGYYLNGQCRISGNYLGGAYNYQHISLEGKKFIQVVPNLVWGTHLTADWLYGDYPDYDKLYLGGMYKLRGYNSDCFSGDPGDLQLIGDQSVVFNTELRFRLPMNKNFETVLFLDAGQVWNQGVSHLKSDYGVGFRYIIPFLGELGFDYYYNTDGSHQMAFIVGETF